MSGLELLHRRSILIFREVIRRVEAWMRLAGEETGEGRNETCSVALILLRRILCMTLLLSLLR